MIHCHCIRFFASAVAVSFGVCALSATATEPIGQSQQFLSTDSFEQHGKDSKLAFESVYNQGVAQYREGQYAAARDLFTRSTAATDRALEAKARFNLANCDYAEAVSLRQENPEEAIGKLETAISHYRGAIEANPQDADARANAELAQLLIDQIQQEQQQDEQQQDEQQQDQDEQQQDEQQQDDQQQDQQSQDQQEQQQDDQQQQDEQQQGEQEQDQDQQQQQDQQSQDQQEQQQDEQQRPSGDQQGAGSQEQSESYQNPGSSEDGQEPQAMTQEEAEKMLQAVRDRDLKRRYEKLRKTQRYYQPVDRDW